MRKNLRIRLITLYGRQKSLDRQMPGTNVFDYRREYKIHRALEEDLGRFGKNVAKEPELWFLNSLQDSESIGNLSRIIRPSKKPFVVSGLIPQGRFTYHWLGVEDSEKEYVAIRTDKAGVKKAIDKIRGENGSEITCGLKVDMGRTLRFLKEYTPQLKYNLAKEFLKLPLEEQQGRLEKLL